MPRILIDNVIIGHHTLPAYSGDSIEIYRARPADKLRVMVVSQQVFFRTGLTHTLQGVPDIETSFSDDLPASVYTMLDEIRPEVIIIDLDGQENEMIEMTHEIRRTFPDTAVITLTSSPGDEQLYSVLRAQAAAYLDKNIDVAGLTGTIRRAARGEYPISEHLATRPEVADKVLREFHQMAGGEKEKNRSPFTCRETEILNFMAQGFLNKQIANEIGISAQTIKNHVTSILRKLNAGARTEAVVIALKQGYISLGNIETANGEKI
jgi:two-component system, NarL family, response regulator DegU